jgi:hypothetical protein
LTRALKVPTPLQDTARENTGIKYFFVIDYVVQSSYWVGLGHVMGPYFSMELGWVENLVGWVE